MSNTDTTTRPDFPIEQFAETGVCPSCEFADSVQSVDHALRWWDGAQVVNGNLSFNGSFEWGEDSVDEHISCWNCGAEWNMPEKVEYR